MPAKKKPTRSKSRTTARSAPRASRAASRPPKPQSVTPYLVVSDATEALEWYKRALGAKEFSRVPGPGGKIMHAGFTIGTSQVLLSDAFPGSDIQPPTTVGGTTVNLHIWTKNADKVWQAAVAAGAKVAMPLEDQFWGDRYGKLTDPYGHSWAVAAKSKLSKAELDRKREEAMRQFGAMS
jgi:PhnB protein